jgi:hypothetical protein
MKHLIAEDLIIHGQIHEYFTTAIICVVYMIITAPLMMWFIIDHMVCTKKKRSYITSMILNTIACTTYIMPFIEDMTLTSQFMTIVIASMLQLYVIDVIMYIYYIRWLIITGIIDIVYATIKYAIWRISRKHENVSAKEVFKNMDKMQ